MAEPSRKVRRAMRWVDEYLSRSAEYVLAALSTELDEAEAPARVRKTIRDAAVEEARYRGGQQFGPTLTLEATDEEMEEIEYRHHMTKRFTSSVLWLRTDVRDAQRWALHALYAVSAGVAMAFAVSAAVIYGNPADPQRVWIWALVMVVAYMFKDRIKAWLQEFFAHRITGRLPDRRWLVSEIDGERTLASITEHLGLVDASGLPPEVVSLRKSRFRSRLEKSTRREAIIHHRKAFAIQSDEIRHLDDRFVSLTEIFRLNLARWLTHADDSKRKVAMADPEAGKIINASLRRVYDIPVLYRIRTLGDDTAKWHAVTIVVSRSGIRRIAQIN